MAEQASQTYAGSCHCGAYQFSVKLPVLKQVHNCNCSICFKKGYLWVFPASDDDFRVEKGDGTLTNYEFGNKTMAHKFCPSCGTSVMCQKHAEGGHSIGINVRALKDVDVEQLEVRPYDGASLGSPYKSPAVSKSPKTKTDDTRETYNGSCHCGKVTYEVKSEPLSKIGASECNCSICALNAYLWLYPKKPDIDVQGEENLHCYRFNSMTAGHSFCTTCGVAVLNQLVDPDGTAPLPVNIRTLNDVDLKDLKIHKLDGKNVADLEEYLRKRKEEWKKA